MNKTIDEKMFEDKYFFGTEKYLKISLLLY